MTADSGTGSEPRRGCAERDHAGEERGSPHLPHGLLNRFRQTSTTPQFVRVPVNCSGAPAAAVYTSIMPISSLVSSLRSSISAMEPSIQMVGAHVIVMPEPFFDVIVYMPFM